MKLLPVLPVAALIIVMQLFPGMAAAQNCKESIRATTPDANFTLHADGTVSDNTTGLMWMRCSLGQTWDGKTCAGSATGFAWGTALQTAQKQEFAGYKDWRVPNKNELESIIEERCASPMINATIFPATPPIYFWTSSPYAGQAHAAWSIDFAYGSVNASVKSGGNLHVRLVRNVW